MIRIGSLEVDIGQRQVRIDGVPLRIGSRAFDILAVLLSRRSALVSKAELIGSVWPDTVVEDNNLQVHVSALRKKLAHGQVLIQTVPGRGYRLVESKRDHAANHAGNTGNPVVGQAAQTVTGRNLPVYGSEFIGREAELSDLAHELATGSVVTLVGAGGIGKTRLAVEVARRNQGRFADGMCFVSLASANDKSAVLDAVADAVGMNASTGGLTLERIVQALGNRAVLTILDNCEHVLVPVAEIADAIARRNINVRILATSREALRIEDERVFRVDTLTFPLSGDVGADIIQCSAVRLFLARARADASRFSSDERSVELIGAVCRRLDGIPLAIEIAAARASVLGVETLAARLDDRIMMLTGGRRMSLPRHQTLRATLDWSHGLLTDAEKITLRRLGIFRSAFTVEAAIEIARDGALREHDVMSAVAGLVEKSLIVRQSGGGTARFRLLETTRTYALEKLDENGERRRTTLSHARFFASLVDQAIDHAPSQDSDAWQRAMRESLDDLRFALNWALSPKGDAQIVGETLAVRLLWLLFELSLVEECCVWARRSLDVIEARATSETDTARLQRTQMQLKAGLAASLVYVNGPDRETRAIWAEVLSSAIALGDQSIEARALWGLWNAAQSAGEIHNATAFARRFASLVTNPANPQATHDNDEMLSQRIIGIASHYAGNQIKAQEILSRFMRHAHKFRFRIPLGRSIDQYVVAGATLARVLWLRGNHREAFELAAECTARAREQEQAIVLCYVLIEATIPLDLLSGRADRAVQSIDMLREVATRSSLTVAMACSQAFEQYRLSFDADAQERLPAFAAALSALEKLEFMAPISMLSGQYARTLGKAGRVGDALDSITRAMTRADQTGDLWYASELSRIRGDLLILESPIDASHANRSMEAHACYQTALDTAIRQGARLFEFRATMSLARTAILQNEKDHAKRLLETACSLAPEREEWAEQDQARAWLTQLQ